MILPLPFAHVAMLRKSSRHKARPYRVRGYAFADLPELGRRDMKVVLTHEENWNYWNEPRHRSGEVLHWRNRLFRAVKEGGRSLTGERFAQALASPPSRYNRDPEGVRFDTPFPTPDIRAGEERDQGPCSLPDLDQLLAELGSPRHQLVSLDFDAQAVAAQARYVDQIVLVDGLVHVECPEPVWVLDGRTSAPDWTLRPDRDHAVRTYRLDRLPGPGWVGDGTLRVHRSPGGHRTLTLLEPSLLGRDDVRELARFAIATWPKFRHWCLRRYPGRFERDAQFAAVAKTIASGRVSEFDHLAVLDTFARIRSELSGVQRFRDAGHSTPYVGGAIATRWKAERDEYLERLAPALSKDDEEALIGI